MKQGIQGSVKIQCTCTLSFYHVRLVRHTCIQNIELVDARQSCMLLKCVMGKVILLTAGYVHVYLYHHFIIIIPVIAIQKIYNLIYNFYNHDYYCTFFLYHYNQQHRHYHFKIFWPAKGPCI